MKLIESSYPKDSWFTEALKKFEFEYCLEVMLQKSYKKIYMVIKNKAPVDPKNNFKNLITKQFEIFDGQRN